MHKHHFFVILLAGLLWGIICSIFFDVWATIGMITSVIMFFVWILFVPSIRLFVIIPWVIAVFIGIESGDAAVNNAQSDHIFEKKTIVFDGIVLRDATQKMFRKQSIVALRRCKIDTVDYSEECAIDKLLVRTSLYTEYFTMREDVSGTCVLKEIQNFSDTFDYVMYRAKDGVYYECDVSVIKQWQSSYMHDKAYAVLAHARARMEKILITHMPQPHAALAAGLLFGGDDRLSQKWQDQFSTVGLTHIVAVSGYNVSVIAHFLIIFGIFVGLWRRHAIWIAIGGIILFILLIGAPTPAIRAGIMGVTVLLFAYAGRLSQALPALLLSAVMMLMYNPLLIRYDVGFQLSFLATLGIILLYPLADHFMNRRKTSFGLSEIIMVTVSAQLFVVPIIAYYFTLFSPVSLLVNILVLPTVPVAMFFACITIICSFLFAPIAVLFGWMTYVIIFYVFMIVDFFAQIPYASITVAASSSFLFLWYSVIAIIVLILRKKYQSKCTKHCNDLDIKK